MKFKPLILSLSTVLFFNGAKASTAVVPIDTKVATTLTVENLEQVLKNDKEKKIPAISKALNLMKVGRFALALKELRALEYNSDFRDYFHFLSGQAELGRLKYYSSTKNWANAVSSGSQAAYHFGNVQGANAYTPLQKRALTMWGEAEVLLGDVFFKMKKPVKSVQAYENGFQRLAQVERLALTPVSSIVNYAMMCEKFSSDVCVSWEAKLAPYVIKSPESRALERIAAFKAPQGITIERSSSLAYKIDLDLQAFQDTFRLYLTGKYEEAYVGFKRIIDEYPRTSIKLRTKFWMARCAQKSNHDVQAETLFREVIQETPFSYYALLSSWFGGISLSRMMSAELPIALTQAPVLSPADLVHIRRAEKLIASDAPELALHELREVQPRENMPNQFLTYLSVLNHLAGNHLAVFRIFGELSARRAQDLFSRYGTKLAFPSTYLPLVKQTAKPHGLDPLLVISLIKQESAFDTEAFSSANAYGLMQLIRPTAKDLDPHIEVTDLLVPDRNVKLGSLYLRQLMARFKGNVILALAGYNAGPSNAERWSKEIVNSPEEMIEIISFRETREYVSNILRNYYWYHKRINGDGFLNLTQLLTSAGAGFRSPASRHLSKKTKAHTRAVVKH